MLNSTQTVTQLTTKPIWENTMQSKTCVVIIMLEYIPRYVKLIYMYVYFWMIYMYIFVFVQLCFCFAGYILLLILTDKWNWHLTVKQDLIFSSPLTPAFVPQHVEFHLQRTLLLYTCPSASSASEGRATIESDLSTHSISHCCIIYIHYSGIAVWVQCECCHKSESKEMIL